MFYIQFHEIKKYIHLFFLITSLIPSPCDRPIRIKKTEATRTLGEINFILVTFYRVFVSQNFEQKFCQKILHCFTNAFVKQTVAFLDIFFSGNLSNICSCRLKVSECRCRTIEKSSVNHQCARGPALIRFDISCLFLHQ